MRNRIVLQRLGGFIPLAGFDVAIRPEPWSVPNRPAFAVAARGPDKGPRRRRVPVATALFRRPRLPPHGPATSPAPSYIAPSRRPTVRRPMRSPRGQPAAPISRGLRGQNGAIDRRRLFGFPRLHVSLGQRVLHGEVCGLLLAKLFERENRLRRTTGAFRGARQQNGDLPVSGGGLIVLLQRSLRLGEIAQLQITLPHQERRSRCALRLRQQSDRLGTIAGTIRLRPLSIRRVRGGSLRVDGRTCRANQQGFESQSHGFMPVAHFGGSLLAETSASGPASSKRGFLRYRSEMVSFRAPLVTS